MKDFFLGQNSLSYKMRSCHVVAVLKTDTNPWSRLRLAAILYTPKCVFWLCLKVWKYKQMYA